ncbi:MAG TPA: hypothetical protein VHQ70_09140 [Syntrophomonadaceae bacterium]|nr:hypothetical protein [Syntrophomonadaceae bacterium]
MFGFTSLIPDSVNGSLILSVFDFFACFFVLYFIGMIIRGVSAVIRKFEVKKDA